MTDTERIEELNKTAERIKNTVGHGMSVSMFIDDFLATVELLNRQQAEIVRLKSPKFFIENEVSEKELSEMLKNGSVGVIPHIKCSIKRIDEDGIRADAIKGFADKLDTYIMWHFPIDAPFVADIRLKIDKLVKEMVGESNVETDITANI